MRFWQRWYFPANTTLYLVGDFGQSVEDCRKLIEASFGAVPAVRQGHELTPHVFGQAPKRTNSNGAATAIQSSPLKERHEVGIAINLTPICRSLYVKALKFREWQSVQFAFQ